MHKLLIISGPTATGKTSLALKLAEKLNGELISADSRQVYKLMDVVTGKDLGEIFNYQLSNLQFRNRDIGFYTDGKIRIWGCDIWRPDEDGNASDYASMARKAIKDIWKRGKLPIIVGGTGFYINALLGKYPSLDVPKNVALREKLLKLNKEELYELLLKRAPARAMVLNNSDRNNRRRLVRAIEVAEFVQDKGDVAENDKFEADILWLGLYLSAEKLKQKIAKRVNGRLGKEMEKEINYLKVKGYLHMAPARTLGYQQWIKYLEGELSQKEAVEEWKNAEYKYAKRQMTWFRKQPEIVWLRADDKQLLQKVDERVKKWYA